MPTLSVHLSVALEASVSIGSQTLSRHLGDLYLGSVAPDIRALIGVPREATHYVGLTDETGKCGIGLFLQTHPVVTNFSLLSGAAKSFVAGYLSHLITDETWITEIYRPFFGIGSALEALPESNILDRALQYELEQRERNQLQDVVALGSMIGQAEGFAGLGVSDDDALRRWREFINGALQIDDMKQRFRHFSSSLLRQGQPLPANRNEGFAVAFPALAARALQHVPESSISYFRQKSIDATVEVFEEYLAGDFLALMER